MSILKLLTLVGGLALFLYGMEVMSDALKKCAGNQLKTILGNLTSNQFKGFLLGLAVTCVIQSSSATTVMVVGFVNSGVMLLSQAIGVIMGANVGTAITAWLTGLSGIGGSGEQAAEFLSYLKPSAWTPILALIGICLVMFSKHSKHKDFGTILLGFSVLMFGMESMSAAVSGLKDDEGFRQLLTAFENPILGVLAGTIVTAIVQSSSASVGILQSLTTTGAITYNAAIPIIMGQNIGTCVTALISSFGATKNGKRAALAHLYFNIIGVVFWLSILYIVNAFMELPFMQATIDMWGVAFVHTIFKLLSVALIAPFAKYLEKLAVMSVRDSDKKEEYNALDERLLSTPTIAVERSQFVSNVMANDSINAVKKAISILFDYNKKTAEEINELEGKVDIYEDKIGTYLVKVCSEDMPKRDSRKAVELLHIINDIERISDHAINIINSSEEIHSKSIEFSEEARAELSVLLGAIDEILSITQEALTQDDTSIAAKVEPLEQVIDGIITKIRLRHVDRLQKGNCTIELGFVLTDLLTNFERISDHCSNIAIAMIAVENKTFDTHEFLDEIKHEDPEFKRMYHEYKQKYSLKKLAQ